MRCNDVLGDLHTPLSGYASRRTIAYFIGLSAALIVVGAIAGTAGFYIADSIPHVMQIGMVFLAPVYFFVFLIVQVRTRLAAIALIAAVWRVRFFTW
jgi:predicted branched-subunit amino acid permease